MPSFSSNTVEGGGNPKMNHVSISLFWQFVAWLMEKLGLDKPKHADKETIDFLKSKGFHFEEKEEEFSK